MISYLKISLGAQWLRGRVLDSRPRGCGFESHRCHCVVFLSKNINPSLVLVQPKKTSPFITERLLMGRKETNQTKIKISSGSFYSLNFATPKINRANMQNNCKRNSPNIIYGLPKILGKKLPFHSGF